MSIDPNIWLSSNPQGKSGNEYEKNNIDNNVWLNTLPEKKIKSRFKIYPFSIILLIIGLVIVSAVKNKTRNLQKEINNLHAKINSLKVDLHRASLDHEVITSPENISRLAKEYLDSDFLTYNKSQIKSLDDQEITSKKSIEIKSDKDISQKNKTTTKKIKIQLANKIEKKKAELNELKKIYYEPKKIPEEFKSQIAKKIEKTKVDLEKLYSSPKETITLEKTQKWAVIQLVKAFLGMPIIPGK